MGAHSIGSFNLHRENRREGKLGEKCNIILALQKLRLQLETQEMYGQTAKKNNLRLLKKSQVMCFWSPGDEEESGLTKL